MNASRTKHALVLALLAGAGFAAGIATKEDTRQSARPPSGTSPRRTESSLRSGDPGRIMETMRGLADDDPRKFVTALNRLPVIDGMIDLVSTAARNLAHEDPESAAEILNGIKHSGLRHVAWVGYLKALEDRSLLEKIGIAGLAGKRNISLTYSGVVAPAMETDPEGTVRTLREAGQTGSYCSALTLLGKEHADQVIGNLKEDFTGGRLQALDCLSILETITSQTDQPQTAVASIKHLAGNVAADDWPAGLNTDYLFVGAFDMAGTGEKDAVVDAICSLPSLRKNTILHALPMDNDTGLETASRILNSIDSAELQESVLKQWSSSGATPEQLEGVLPLLGSAKTRDKLRTMIAGGGQ